MQLFASKSETSAFNINQQGGCYRPPAHNRNEIMNDEIKYPYIGKSIYSDNLVLFNKKGCGALIDSTNSEYKGFVDWLNESTVVDLTKETLQNTYGEVLSPEHAEFIIELCEVNGIEVFNGFDIGITNFAIVKNEVIFTYGKPSVSEHDKKITIPLPPKPEASAGELTTEEETELKSLCMVSALNNEIENQKTWPQVGDKVTVFGRQGVLVLPADANGMYVVESNGRYFIPKLSDMTKPKSKQDLLIEELQSKLVNNNAVDNYILACDIINGDIDGLSYNVKG